MPDVESDAPLIHPYICTCKPECKPGGVCQWVGCCRSPIESARVTPPAETGEEPS